MVHAHALNEQMWAMMGLVRVYTKKPGTKPDFNEPVVLSEDRGGTLVENFCKTIHRDLVTQLNYALVWGKSVKVQRKRRRCDRKNSCSRICVLLCASVCVCVCE